MRKFLFLILLCILSLTFTSCKIPSGNGSPDSPSKEPVSPLINNDTSDISSGITNNSKEFFYQFDLDYDGQKEQITIKTPRLDNDEQVLVISAGDITKQYDMWDGHIASVYICDIEKKDNARDIAVITAEGSDDPRIRIFSYRKGLTPYSFICEHDTKKEEYDYKALGYAVSFYFNVNDDNTVTMEEQTNCAGMWSVYKNYKLNQNGAFEEIPRDKYDILPDFMERKEQWLDTSAEKGMWQKGYIRAGVPYSNASISISEGEYIKPLYDDGKELLYVQKEDGSTGYINIGYDSFPERNEFNGAFFMLAG